MRLIPLAAAAALALSPLSAPALAQAQSQAQAPAGLSVGAVRDWIVGLGGEVSEIHRTDGETYVTVTDSGLTWALLFYSCRNDVCGDMQFSAVFANPAITPDMVNAWNRDQRFLKAFYAPATGSGANPTATVQYDVLALPGLGVEQLADPLSIWLELSRAFAVHVGYFQAQPQGQ